MKNIFLLPSDKPSRLAYDFDEKCYYLQNDVVFFEHQYLIENRNIYITNDEEINKDTKPCWCVNTIKNTWNDDLIYYQGAMPQYHFIGFKKIILTTDPELIKNGVQAIDNDFLEWFFKNSSCEFVEVKKTTPIRPFGCLYVPIIPQPKQETCDNCNNDICCCIIRKQETIEEVATVPRQVADIYQPLFNFFTQEHHLILTISEMDEIVYQVAQFTNQFNKQTL